MAQHVEAKAAATTNEWTPRPAHGAFAALCLVAYLAVQVPNWPRGEPLLEALATAMATWLGSLALIHLLRAPRTWMRVPATAALALAVGGFLTVAGFTLLAHTWSASEFVLSLPLPLALIAFGRAHLAASAGRSSRRALRAAWILVGLSALATLALLVLAIGHSGMGGG